MLYSSPNEIGTASSHRAFADACADTGPFPQPVSASFIQDPAVQVALHDLNQSFKNFDKCIDSLVRITEHKVMGRVPNFRFDEDEPAVTVMEPLGTVTDRVLGDLLSNMINRRVFKPKTPWTFNIAGDVFDLNHVKLGTMAPAAAAHVVAAVNAGAK